MDKLERIVWLVTQCALTLVMITFCVKLCAGCTSTGKAKVEETISFVLKEAYVNGGKTAVSNRIEGLVIDGKITAEQAHVLHAAAEKIYQDVIEHLDAGNPTNAVITVE